MSDIRVKIEGIVGDEGSAEYEGQISCTVMRHTIDLPVRATTDPRAEGNSAHGAIELTHKMDRATPALRHAAAQGTNLNTVVITRMQSDDGTKKLETITLKNAHVVSLETDTPLNPETLEPGDEPLETFGLDYSEIVWNYETGNARGGYSVALKQKA